MVNDMHHKWDLITYLGLIALFAGVLKNGSLLNRLSCWWGLDIIIIIHTWYLALGQVRLQQQQTPQRLHNGIHSWWCKRAPVRALVSFPTASYTYATHLKRNVDMKTVTLMKTLTN